MRSIMWGEKGKVEAEPSTSGFQLIIQNQQT
jgi:hypothetical protein